jgi:stearoyl-CoA desaturase (delta-9 desaturase)
LVQFLFAALGNASAQRGPLWWAAHHRHHHRFSDQPEDSHSPRQSGFLWSHMGWFFTRANFRTKHDLVKDWARFPELRFLDRFDVLMPALLFAGTYVLGEAIAHFWPQSGTNGWQMLVWGGAISTVVVFHATCSINSLTHVFGRRRFTTTDDSRNSLILALLTMGEGWHNNHHHYAVCCRQGFYWWELDLTYYLLRAMAAVGLVRDLRPVPPEVLAAGAGR